jgi:hypothetical protein
MRNEYTIIGGGNLTEQTTGKMLETLCGGVDRISPAHYWIVVLWLIKQQSLLDACHNLILHALHDLRSYSDEL